MSIRNYREFQPNATKDWLKDVVTEAEIRRIELLRQSITPPNDSPNDLHHSKPSPPIN